MATMQPVHSCVPPPPPPDLQLHLVVDDDEDSDEGHGAGSRRPSTASLSRFRSCPQLASLMNTSQDSPCSDMAPIMDKEGNIMHTTPMLRNSLCVDMPGPDANGIRSAASTPTPPSTPGSRRRNQMTSSYHSKTEAAGDGASPPSTSKLLRQSTTGHISGAMAFSMDSQGGFLDDWIPFQNEGIQRCNELHVRSTGSPVNFPFDDFRDHALDDEPASEADDGSSMHLNGRYASRTDRRLYCNYFHGGPGDDSVDKCNRWLQSLKLTKSDKIKSRSHIQLPPV